MRPAARFLLLFLLALPITAQKRPRPEIVETRRHFVLVTPRQEVAYEITTVQQLSESRDLNLVLIQESGGERYIASDEHSYFDQQVNVEIAELDTKGYVLFRMKMPYKALTRSGAIAEMKGKEWSPENTEFTIEAGGLSRTGKESEWNNPAIVRAWRRELRQAAGAKIIEAVESFRGTLFPQLFTFCEHLKYLFYGNACAEKSLLVEKYLPPDCDFDAAFGHPCSDEQRRRVERARKNLDRMESY